MEIAASLSSHIGTGERYNETMHLLLHSVAWPPLASSPAPQHLPPPLRGRTRQPHRIDVHHHIVPPTWLDALKQAKLDNPPLTSWTPQRSIEDMDKAGTATAITSPTSPQVGFLPAAGRGPRRARGQ